MAHWTLYLAIHLCLCPVLFLLCGLEINEFTQKRLFCSGNTFDNQIVEIAGWGTTAFGGSSSNQPARLQKTTVTTLSNGACKSMDDSPSFAASHVTEAILCTYSTTGQDACQMDSGGGLMWRNERWGAGKGGGGGGGDGRLYLVGVISYGWQCGRNTPGFNTRVTNYLNWIIANSRGANFCIPG